MMPVLFIGHGSPMNALADNHYTQTLGALGASIPKPRSILCVSAHWMTQKPKVTHMPRPKTIHDFFGFPRELFEVHYPAPGNPALAERVANLLRPLEVSLDDHDWGLDHGAWSVLRHLYPLADLPVVQLSLDMSRTSKEHFAIGQALRPLRDEGVLILGSGNVVHHLGMIRWEPDAPAFDWALRFEDWVASHATSGSTLPLIDQARATSDGKQSIPTWDHWLPLLYCLGAAGDDRAKVVYQGIENASISMLSLLWDKSPMLK